MSPEASDGVVRRTLNGLHYNIPQTRSPHGSPHAHMIIESSVQPHACNWDLPSIFGVKGPSRGATAGSQLTGMQG